MMFLYFVIDLIEVYFSKGFDLYWWAPFLALMFLCTVPALVRDIVLRRSH